LGFEYGDPEEELVEAFHCLLGLQPFLKVIIDKLRPTLLADRRGGPKETWAGGETPGRRSRGFGSAEGPGSSTG